MQSGNEYQLVAAFYIFVGTVGFICNFAVVVMILTIQVYHKSAYMLMGNIAVADAVQSIIVGCYIGVMIISNNDDTVEQDKVADFNCKSVSVPHVVSILTINAWFVMIYSYALLGVNRCIGTCFYKTKLRRFNQTGITTRMIVVIWIASFMGGLTASFPMPIIFVQPRIYTMRFVVSTTRSIFFFWFNVVVNVLSIIIQWISSAFVLTTVRRIQHRISNRSISNITAHRSQRQVRLSFQFFYPSIICTLSSLMFFTMPFYAHLMTRWHFLLSHLVWLINHICNPFIYAYFNDRMRDTLRFWLKCRQDDEHDLVTVFPTQSRGTSERQTTRKALVTV